MVCFYATQVLHCLVLVVDFDMRGWSWCKALHGAFLWQFRMLSFDCDTKLLFGFNVFTAFWHGQAPGRLGTGPDAALMCDGG